MRRILLALCALTMLGGCGGGVDPSLLAAAVQNTEQAGGAEIAFQAKLEMPGGAEMTMTGSGVEDALGRRARLTFGIPQAGEMEVVADGLTMYMRSDIFESAVGKEWMKMDLERASEALGVQMDGLSQVGQGASQQLGMLRAVSDGVTEHGRDTVVGVEATHYSATIDLRRYPDVAPEAERETVRRSVERLIELTGQNEIPIDVWIDDQQRVRRMEWEQVLSNAGGVEVRGELTAEYVRFGVPVDIDVPDDDEVFDATQLGIEQLQREHP